MCRDTTVRRTTHAATAAHRRVVIEAGADDTQTHHARDHPPPQHISGDSAASPRPSMQSAPRWSLATGGILSSAAADNDDAGRRPGDSDTV